MYAGPDLRDIADMIAVPWQHSRHNRCRQEDNHAQSSRKLSPPTLAITVQVFGGITLMLVLQGCAMVGVEPGRQRRARRTQTAKSPAPDVDEAELDDALSRMTLIWNNPSNWRRWKRKMMRWQKMAPMWSKMAIISIKSLATRWASRPCGGYFAQCICAR